jgi:hypothetical protein
MKQDQIVNRSHVAYVLEVPFSLQSGL